MRKLAALYVLPAIIVANPVWTDIINEFQVDTVIDQQIEFHFPKSFPYAFPLAGADVRTPGNYAYVDDTTLYLPSGGFAIIDTSVLDGAFFMPLDNGYIETYLWEYFSGHIMYPDTGTNYTYIPAPLPGASVARYVMFVDYGNYELPMFDWYLDYTPTLGYENDDYSGCKISGYVYFNGSPYENATVSVNCLEIIVDPDPFYMVCTTFTSVDGYYSFDSLLPSKYWIKASFPGHYQYIGTTRLRTCRPLNDFNFYFTGIEEKQNARIITQKPNINIAPNPFHNKTEITFHITDSENRMSVKIYAYNGRLVKSITRSNIQSHQVVWHGDDNYGNPLPSGVYVAQIHTGEYTQTRKLLLVK